MSDPLNPLLNSQMLAAREFLISKQLHFNPCAGISKAEMRMACLTQFHRGLLWMTVFGQDLDSALSAHVHMY